jgi:hypothetical protein
VADQVMIGPIQIEFRYQGHRCVMSNSGDTETLKRIADESEVIQGVKVPTWIEYSATGGADPDMHVRVELRDGSPQVVELSWKAQQGQGEIRRKHLRQIDLEKLVTDLVVSMIEKPVPAGLSLTRKADVDQLREASRKARKFVERQRLPRARRVMTPEFLEAVAQVYRENIDGKPTKAVGETFNVQSRMASKYVDAARQRGYLPKTERGKKKA